MKTIGVIQARIGSTRLPCKMMLNLNGHPIIEWVVKRVQKSSLNEIVVAIPDSKENDVLEKYLKNLDVKIFRGDENNVLKRFCGALEGTLSTHFVRICADNPLIDPAEIDNLIKFFKTNNCDYAYNHIPKGNLYPDGLGAEIISIELFFDIFQKVTLSEHKEHALSYIWDNQEKYNIKTFDPNNEILKRPDLKFDIDTFSDYYKLAMKDFDIDVSSLDLVKIFGE